MILKILGHDNIKQDQAYKKNELCKNGKIQKIYGKFSEYFNLIMSNHSF